jgi:DNA-binding MarR family transcriptional regulator
VIDKLVRRRLVRRSEGAKDRREKVVSLSAKGDSLLKKVAGARAARFDASLAVLSSSLSGKLADLLAEVLQELDNAQPISRSHLIS